MERLAGRERADEIRGGAVVHARERERECVVITS